MINADGTGQVAAGLVQYVRTVAGYLGSWVTAVEVEPHEEVATAIIVVNTEVPAFAGWTVLLTWDEVSGWALRLKIDEDGDTTPLQYLGHEILPAPEIVRDFLREATQDQHEGTVLSPAFRRANANDDLELRLARLV